MRALVLPVVVACGLLPSAASAQAAPPGFPDVEAHPAVDPTDYHVLGAHPSMSGWLFSTESGLQCQDNLIPDIGIICQGPVPGTEPEATVVTVSLAKEGEFSRSDAGLGEARYRLLPTGSKLSAGNGVVCAALAEDTLACRAATPDSWPTDTPDPPDRHYGEHGFVVSPAGSYTY